MRFYFEEAEFWKKRKQAVIQRINQLGVPLVIFGRSGESNPAFLEDITVPVQFICSTNPASWGKRLWGLEVISLERVQQEYQRYTILILPIDYNGEFVSMFQHLEVPPLEIFSLDLHFDDDNTAGYFQSRSADLEEIYSHMADQASKDTYETMIRYRINRDPLILSTIVLPQDAHYFHDFLGGKPFLTSSEVFVDVGAFMGDTVREFVAAVHGEYRHIYALEPTPENYTRLLEETKGVRNISCIQAGASDKENILHFSEAGQASRADPDGNEIVRVDALDRLLGIRRSPI